MTTPSFPPPPDPDPGREPLDPWAEDEAQRQAQRPEGWTSQPGGMGPLPSRTWSRGNTRVMVGGCCLPLPVGCLTLVVAGIVAGLVSRRK